MNALRLFYIVDWNITYRCRLRWLLRFLFHSLPAKREIVSGTTFGMVVEILFGGIVIPTAAFMVAPADRWMQGRVLFIHIIGKRVSVATIRAGMPCRHSFIVL